MGWSSNCAGATGFQLLQSLSTLIHLFPHVQCITPHRSSLSVWLAVWEKGIKTKPLSQISVEVSAFYPKTLVMESFCLLTLLLTCKKTHSLSAFCLRWLGPAAKIWVISGFHSRAWSSNTFSSLRAEVKWCWMRTVQPTCQTALFYPETFSFVFETSFQTRELWCSEMVTRLELHVLKMGDKLSWVLSL